jgi:hypothetical protein
MSESRAAILGALAAPVVPNIVGLPLFFIFRRFGLARWWSACLSGAIAGIFWAEVITLRFDLRNLALLGVEGALAGLAFWVIWKLQAISSRNREARPCG